MALREGGAALRRGAYREGATFGDLQMTVPLPGRRVPSASAGVGRIERGSEHVCLSHACEVREDERATGRGECESVVCVSEQDGVLATCRHASRFWESACDCCDWVRPSARCWCDKQGGQWGAPRGVLLRGYETEQARSEARRSAFRSASGEGEMRACENVTRAETRGEARPSGPHTTPFALG